MSRAAVEWSGASRPRPSRQLWLLLAGVFRLGRQPAEPQGRPHVVERILAVRPGRDQISVTVPVGGRSDRAPQSSEPPIPMGRAARIATTAACNVGTRVHLVDAQVVVGSVCVLAEGLRSGRSVLASSLWITSLG